MEVQKFWTKGKIIMLIIFLALIGAGVGIYFYRRSYLKKEYAELETSINRNVVNYLRYEGIELEDNQYREIDIKKIFAAGLARNKKYEGDCEGYSIAESNNQMILSKTYIKCKNIYVTKGYGTKVKDGKEENTSKTQSENDTTKPVITLLGAKTITLGLGDTYKEPGATAMDNVDGDITKKIKITGTVDTKKADTYTITYTVSDKAKNKATKTRTVIVKNEKTTDDSKKDKNAPVITFKNTTSEQTVCIGSKVDVSKDGIYGYAAYDDVDGDVTAKVKVEGHTGVATTAGKYTLTYTVSDKAKNQAKVTRDYIVTDCSNPTPTPEPTPTPTPTPEPDPEPTPTPQPSGGGDDIDSSGSSGGGGGGSSIDDNIYTRVTSISAPYSLTISVGETAGIYASVIPSNASNQTLYYRSLDSGVATVDGSGYVRGVRTGSTRIIISSPDGAEVGVFIDVR